MSDVVRVWWRAGLLLAGLLALTAVSAADAGGAAGSSSPPPVELFYRSADIQQARLSPSGKRLAVSVNMNGRVGLVVLDVDEDRPPVPVMSNRDADVWSFDWLGEGQLVLRTYDQQAGSGDQPYRRGMFVVSADGKDERRYLEPWREVLLAVPEGQDREVVIGRRVYNGSGDLVEVLPVQLDVRTGRTRSLASGMPDGVIRWWFDRQGQPRVGAASRAGFWRIYWRGPGDSAWRVLPTTSKHGTSWFPHSVDDQGRLYVHVWIGDGGTSELRRFDFERGQPEPEALVRTPGFDFRGGFVRDENGVLLGLRAETDAQTTVWYEPRLKDWQQQADQRLPGRVNRLDCRRCLGEDPVVLVHSWSDRHPGEFWLFRPRRGAGEWQTVGPARRDVDPRQMATLDFHRITTRDGLSMPVWLTQPAGPRTDRRRPAVVLVHGGPWIRGGHWGWHPQAQFLASRGWVVIEPEYRGSKGYGERWFQAGRKQWGRAMQDDLVDALQWAVRNAGVDERRVCIAGGSYGGYAALMAPLRHPGVFRCAASWLGVTDPRAQMDPYDAWLDTSDEARRVSWPALVGDPVNDRALLDEATPLLHAERLTLPIMLSYGRQDRRVPLAQGEAMRRALIAAGRPPEWRVYDDEGHGWLKPENRFDFARRLERFLSRHLDAPADGASAP